MIRNSLVISRESFFVHRTVADASEPSRLTKETEDGVLLNEDCEPMPSLPAGRFTRLPDGRILGVAGNLSDPWDFYISDDEGETWAQRPILPDREDIEVGPTGGLLTTSEGTVILAFANDAERHLTWDDDLRDGPGSQRPTYAMRSEDGGDTWKDIQKLHVDWTGAIRDIIETRNGGIVFTSMKLLHNPGRHAVLTYRSRDDGRSWQPSNIIDLGGSGNHGGAFESTLVELDDGRLMQYLRTPWEQFWLAESDDDGRSWHPYGPSGVDASSAPGMLHRLESGRIALVWPRSSPEGREPDDYDEWLNGGDRIGSAFPHSNFREELSISFSEDEGESWSPPVVIGKDPDFQISYPYIFEPEPGVLWITAHKGSFSAKLREEDFHR